MTLFDWRRRTVVLQRLLPSEMRVELQADGTMVAADPEAADECRTSPRMVVLSPRAPDPAFLPYRPCELDAFALARNRILFTRFAHGRGYYLASVQLAIGHVDGRAARVISGAEPAREADLEGDRVAFEQADCRTTRTVVRSVGRLTRGTPQATPTCPVLLTDVPHVRLRDDGLALVTLRCPRGCFFAFEGRVSASLPDRRRPLQLETSDIGNSGPHAANSVVVSLRPTGRELRRLGGPTRVELRVDIRQLDGTFTRTRGFFLLLPQRSGR